MIRNVFVPEKIGAYYLFSQRIVACELTRTHAKMAVVKAYGYTRIIEQVFDVPVSEDNERPYADRAAEAIRQALSSIGRYGAFYVVLPSNLVIFKELTLPFSTLDQIKQVLPFEVEPLLPFALNDATVDCVITHQGASTSTVMAVAIKNDVLNEYLIPFAAAEVIPHKTTVDLVELYALYRALNAKKDGSTVFPQHVLILYIGLSTIRLAIIVNGQLKVVRFLPQGIGKLARMLGQEPDHVIQAGLHGDQSRELASFFSDVTFTLEAFTTRATEEEKLQKILLCGIGADVKGLSGALEQLTGLNCEVLNGQLILQHGIAKLKGSNGIPPRSVIPVSAALSLPVTEDFNLYKAQEAAAQDVLANRQLFVVAALMLVALGSVFAHWFLTSRSFNKEIQASSKEVVDKLKKELPQLASRVKSGALDTVLNAARGEVAREKTIWFALSTQNRASFLVYLQELNTRLDPEGLGLILTRLKLTDDELTMEGQVRDYEALKRLEEDLRQSKLFVSVPRFQDLKFSAKLMFQKETV